MATYKVAQDVEADDKLIGPFSFRQFIYLIIVALAGVLAWGLSRLFVGLAIIPLPVMLFFGALALPLRKDQPMEVYLAALVSFYLKPRRRIWEPDGIESLVQITVPKVVEIQRSKDLSQTEAERRLSFLADIADTGGWSIRHTTAPPQTSMTTDVYFAAQQTEDILDESGGVARSIDNMMSQADARRREEMMQRMQSPVTAPTPEPTKPANPQNYSIPITTPETPAVQVPTVDTGDTLPDVQPVFNPYPTQIHQAVIRPLSEQRVVPRQPAAPEPVDTATNTSETTDANTSETTLSPDIINLANNSDLSIETIQREANRIKQKAERDDGEVFVSLR